MGFDERHGDLVATLVRWHLLLAETATTRDLDDPATVELRHRSVPDAAGARLLEALTEADARATAPKAWTTWRAGWSATSSAGPAAGARPDEPPAAPRPADASVPDGAGATRPPSRSRSSRRRTARGSPSSPPDRVGLLADVAGDARRCSASRCGPPGPGPQDEYAVSVWEVADDRLDAAILRHGSRRSSSGAVDPADRLRPRRAGRRCAPSVAVRPDASRAGHRARGPGRRPPGRRAPASAPRWPAWT